MADQSEWVVQLPAMIDVVAGLSPIIKVARGGVAYVLFGEGPVVDMLFWM